MSEQPPLPNERLRDSEEMLRVVFDYAPDPYYLCTMTGEFVDGNRAAERVTGYQRDELIGKSFLKLNMLAAADLPRAAGLLARNLVGQASGPDEFQLRRKDGTSVTVEISTRPVRVKGRRLILGIARDISERRRTETALRAKEEKYRNVIENANESIVVLQDGKVQFANPRVSEITGLTFDEFKNESFAELIFPDDRKVVVENYQRRLRGEQVESVYSFRLTVKGGRRLWVEARSALINWEGRPAVLSFMTDITARKNAEMALRESDRKYREFVDALPETVFEANIRGRLTFANQAAFDLFGHTEADIRNGIGILDLIASEDRARAGANAAQTMAGARRGVEEYLAQKKDGSLVPILVHTRPIVLDGKPAGMRGIIIDLTERKRAEEALRVSEEKYRLVVENALEAIVVLQDGMVTYANSRASEMTGYPLDALAARPFPEFIHPDDRRMVVERYTQRLGGEKFGSVYSFRINGKGDRLLWVEVRATFITWQGRPATLNLMTDITERKQAEAQLLTKNAELAALGEQKNQFLGMAAHDLRNPLGILLNYSEFMLSGATGELTADQTRFVATMKRSSEFMLRLINDLLDVAKIESGKVNLELQPVNLAELITQNLALNRLLAEKKGIELIFESDGSQSEVQLDSAKIEQVVDNLITNAVKFSNSGTQVKVGLIRADGHVRISVSDHGLGIPAAELDKLFTPFARTSVKSTGGEKSTGLGLVISKRIIEGHGGTIKVDSEVGKGTTFTVTLPTTETADERRYTPIDRESAFIGVNRRLPVPEPGSKS